VIVEILVKFNILTLSFIGVYYLGVYGYGASVTTPDERAYRLARLDGVETVAMIIATLLSPTISKYIGPYGNYGFGLTLILMSIFYGKMFVREPIKYVRSEIESEKQMRKRSCSDFIYLALVRPLLDMKSVFVRKRTLVVKSVLGVLLLVYSIYNFAYEVRNLLSGIIFFNLPETCISGIPFCSLSLHAKSL